MAFIIKTNTSESSDVTVKDLGIVIPNSGGSEELTIQSDLESASLSIDLVTLCNDDAYTPNGSTLIMNDGVDDVPQEIATDFIRNALITNFLDYVGPDAFYKWHDKDVQTVYIYYGFSFITYWKLKRKTIATGVWGTCTGGGSYDDAWADRENKIYT